MPMSDVAELLCFTPTVIFCVTMYILTFIVCIFSPFTFNPILLPSSFYVFSLDSVWRFIPFRFSTTNFSTTICHWIVAMEVQGRLLQSVLRMLLFTNLNMRWWHG